MATGLDFGAVPGPYICAGCGAGVHARTADFLCGPCSRGLVNAVPLTSADAPVVGDNLSIGDPNSMTQPVPGSDA